VKLQRDLHVRSRSHRLDGEIFGPIVLSVAAGIALAIVTVASYAFLCGRGSACLCSGASPWALFTGIAASITILVTWYWRTREKKDEIRIAESRQITEQFASAVKMLGENSFQANGAIHALARLGRDSPEDRGMVIETLEGYVRMAWPGASTTDVARPTVECVQLALRTLIDPTRIGRDPDIAPDLRGAVLNGINLRAWVLAKIWFTSADLREADMTSADLRRADLSQARLDGACLDGAVLSRANLHNARLSKASLRGAHLEDAYAVHAQLSGADLRSAVLTEARLMDATLTGVRLQHAHLVGAELDRAILSLANLSKANLQGAKLAGANLEGAELAGANLANADLQGAHLADAELTGANFDGASRHPADEPIPGWTLSNGKLRTEKTE
jgi:uncharacterized protein YjbI with pentapeptide repeats